MNGKSIGFVPTMGALHPGHRSLIERARVENEVVVCSIFVNPTQFNDPKDLVNYPRTPELDYAILEEAGCDIVFSPSVEEMYPDDHLLDLNFGDLETVMEGHFRPGHFKGVATVVSRLFSITTPTRAYFGEKDFQQLAVIREMNRRLKTGIEIVSCATLREADGLAMSSRNIHLNYEERNHASIIYKALLFAQHAVHKKR
jgi:pantoate--beta-alanine ligase